VLPNSGDSFQDSFSDDGFIIPPVGDNTDLSFLLSEPSDIPVFGTPNNGYNAVHSPQIPENFGNPNYPPQSPIPNLANLNLHNMNNSNFPNFNNHFNNNNGAMPPYIPNASPDFANFFGNG